MKTLDPELRGGVAVCIAGMLCNLLLSAGKIAVGVLCGSVSVMADGFNNVSDCGSGAVALVSFFIAGKPADQRHPFGHRRAEYIAAMIAGVFVVCLAAELLRESVGSVIGGGAPVSTTPVYLVLGISVAVKLGMFLLYRLAARRLDSVALKAAATDSLCDCLATAAVAIGSALSPLAPSADGWAGIAVALFIAWQGIRLLKRTSSELLGEAPDPALAKLIEEILLSEKDILGVHDLSIYSYGKGASFATIHAEMDACMPMLAAHAVIDEAEMRVKRETGVLLTVHLDPVDLENQAESRLKLLVFEAARELTDGLELHDFRFIPDTNKVEFDVGVPYACKLTDDALRSAIEKIVRDLGAYEPIIRIERE